jgi:perosamine synthetase
LHLTDVAGADGALSSFERRPERPVLFPLGRRLVANTELPFKFAYCRTALKFGLRALGLESGNSILTPAFNCESLLEPLGELGIVPQLYPVHDDLRPDWDALSRLVCKSTKALVIVHFFGQPQAILESKEFCRKHGLYLIEDNAHGFGSTYDGALLGTIGDLGITAPRKSLPLTVGALLHLSSSGVPEPPELQLRPLGIVQAKRWLRSKALSLPGVGHWLLRRWENAERVRRSGSPPDYHSQEAYRDPPIECDYGMDHRSWRYMARLDGEDLKARRRLVYRLWEEWALTQGLEPVFRGLSPGAVPLAFPALTRSSDESRQWFGRGYRAGIDVFSWPTLPMSVVREDGGAMRLWERLVCFPIHQEMCFDTLKSRLPSL